MLDRAQLGNVTKVLNACRLIEDVRNMSRIALTKFMGRVVL
jgi:hypothetical protein